MRFKSPLLSIFVSSTLLATSSSYSTTLEKLEFNDLVQKAATCVVAETKSTKYAMKDGAPVTLTTFSVSKTAFGSTPKTITVVTEGGRLANAKVPMGEVNAGAPKFLNGTSNVLLLNEVSDGNYKVTGYSQGAFDTYRQAGELVVRLPESQGGVTSLEQALQTIEAARTRTESLIEE